MKNSKHFIVRLFATVLVAVFALAAAVPVMAAKVDPDHEPPYTITIHNNEGLPNMKNEQFSAYQVFTGRLHFERKDAYDRNVYTLADIEWGASIKTEDSDGTSLVKALQEAGSKEGSILSYFGSLPEEATAVDVARVLEEHTTTAFLQAFCSFLVGSGVGNEDSWLQATSTSDAGGEGETETYPVKSKLTKGTEAKDDTSTITVNEAGYYLIIEEEENVPSDPEGHYEVVSEYILAVLGDQDINIKADVPTVDKEISNPGENGNGKGDSVGLGDTVTFTLTGTLPTNFADYDSYYYIFTDNLSKGLTFVEDSLKVYIVNETISDDGKLVGTKEEVPLKSVTSDHWVPDDKNPDGGKATESYFPETSQTPNEENGGLQIVIDMGDLKKGYQKYGINSKTKIVIEYSAILNDDAVIGDAGNPNDVKLDYSNNPHDPSQNGDTPEVEVKVYTFNLVLDKVSEKEQLPLAGAVFYLSKETTDGGISYYCKKADSGEYYWSEPKTDGYRPDDAVPLTTNEEGKFTDDVTGLDANVKYTLTESTAPDGYNTIDPFTFEFTVEIDENGNITEEGLKMTDGSKKPGVEWEVNQNTGAANGSLHVTVDDPRAPFLPFTGGAGLVVFYVVGGLLLAGAAVFIVISGRKSKKSKE